MYVCMYVCKYIYSVWYSHPSPRRPSGKLCFAALASTDWSLQLRRTYRSSGCYSQTSAHRSSRGSSQPSLQCKCMYVDTFIPYHMYIYVCKYINSMWYSHPLSCRSSNYFRSYSSTVKRWLKLAATPHLPVYRLLFAVDAAAVQPRFFTAILALNGIAACMYVCMLESIIILF